MAKFQIYQFMFSPVMNPTNQVPRNVDVNESLAQKQEILESLFEDANFILQAGESQYRHMMPIHQGGITILRVANNRKRTVIPDFDQQEKVDHHPNCHILIDNRHDMQTIAIERQAGAFTPNKLAAILEASFNNYLAAYRLSLKIRPKTYSHEFWEFVAKYPNDIEWVQFTFPYPNLPKISDKIGPYMTSAAKAINGEPTTKFVAQNGQALTLNREDPILNDWVDACAASGTPTQIKPFGVGTPLKCAMDTPVEKDLSNSILEHLSDPRTINDKFNSVSTWLNNIKLVYE